MEVAGYRKLNYDASQFPFKVTGRNKVVVTNTRDKSRQVQGAGADGTLNVFIKYVALASANGRLAAPIFVIINKTLEEDACHAENVMGLSCGSCTVEGSGWVVVMHPNANKQFNTIFFEEAVPTFVQSLRNASASALREVNGPDSPVLCFGDGEQHQLDFLMEDDAARANYLLDKFGIVFAKFPASSTDLFQRLGVGKLFKAATAMVGVIKNLQGAPHRTAEQEGLGGHV